MTFAELAGQSEPHVTGLWRSQIVGAMNSMRCGAKFSDGTSKRLFDIDLSQYDSRDAAAEAIRDGYAKCGVDATAILDAAQRQERMTAAQQALWEAMANGATFGRAMPGSGFYQRATRDEVPGSAYSDHAGDAFAYMRGQQGQRGPDGPAPAIHDPERIKAVERARSLKTLADHATANPGEAANARAALDRLKAKHQIEDREL